MAFLNLSLMEKRHPQQLHMDIFVFELSKRLVFVTSNNSLLLAFPIIELVNTLPSLYLP